MSMASTVSGVLQTALKRVQRAWTSGAWKRRRHNRKPGEPATEYCLVGAVRNGRYSQTQQQKDAEKLLVEVLEEQYPDWLKGKGREWSIGHVPRWNDYPGRKPEEVERVVEKALRRAEERGL